MPAITISRELGSEGDYIAEKVAQVLGYHFVEKKLISDVLDQYGLVDFDKEYDALLGFWDRFNAQREKRRELMADMLRQVVRAMAQHGNVVILGRSGFAFLRGFADVLNVRVQAPLPSRVKRVIEQQGIAAEQAEAAVVASDKARAAFVESFYGLQQNASGAFDLAINTDKVSPDLAAAWITQAAQALAERVPSDAPTCGSISVDAILAAAVSDQLRCTASHR